MLDEGYSALLENEFHAIKAKDNSQKNLAFVLIYWSPVAVYLRVLTKKLTLK